MRPTSRSLSTVYSFPMVTHFAIEPHGAIAYADDDGLTIWSPVQHPYLLQRTISDLFEQPLARVRVLAPDPGGAFGGKQNPKFEPLLTWLALKTGRPCRLILTLEETFQAVRRTSCSIHVRSGFRANGELVFHDVESDFLVGAYADIAERVVAKANYLACGPYRTPNARIVARAILSNTTPSCAFRGFGTPAGRVGDRVPDGRGLSSPAVLTASRYAASISLASARMSSPGTFQPTASGSSPSSARRK